jgi:hypothetical protein
MKQGQAQTSRMGSTKVEPSAKAVNIEHVAEMGIHQVRHTSVPMYEGRGLEAPMAGSEVHHCGSQGKHK